MMRFIDEKRADKKLVFLRCSALGLTSRPSTSSMPRTARGISVTCNWNTGGSCVSWAAAESIFGWSASDLLPRCAAGCTVGSTCDAGWQHRGSTFAYQRVAGSCGPCADGEHHSCGKCGDGTCDAGEFPKLCPNDCYCGDGQCAPEEVTTWGSGPGAALRRRFSRSACSTGARRARGAVEFP